jgi:transcriptional regulator with XRE-family HTH domain
MSDSALTIGQLLKQGRLKQHLSLSECAKRTHVSSRYLEAIEEEKWEDLPSESHRIGFLQLYARFLGISADEALSLYKRVKTPEPAAEFKREPNGKASESSATPIPKRPAAKPSTASTWEPGSPQNIIIMTAALIIGAWFLYHALGKGDGSEMHVNLWVHPRINQTRLIQPKPVSTAPQHMRVQAEADSWLRIQNDHRLLFEGIIHGGTSKQWEGPGPYRLKIGNVKAVSIFWNDQPVDLSGGPQGGIRDFQLPVAPSAPAPVKAP